MMNEWHNPVEEITNEVVINFIAHTAHFSAHLAKSFGISRKDFEKMCEVCTEGQWGPK